MVPILCKIIAWSPLIQILVLSLGILISFLVAYFKKDVTIYLPFISENGAIVPEMCIFSFTLIIGSFIGILIVLYRYLVLEYLLSDHNQGRLKTLNLWSLWCGIFSMLGFAGAAAFPMSTVFVVHLVFAAVLFIFAMVYLWINAYMGFKMQSINYKPAFVKTRFILCILFTLFLLLLTIFMPLGYFNWKKLHPDVLPALKTPKDEGFALLVCGTLFEWLLCITYFSYIITFLKEFKKFHLKSFVESVEKENYTDYNSPIMQE